MIWQLLASISAAGAVWLLVPRSGLVKTRLTKTHQPGRSSSYRISWLDRVFTPKPNTALELAAALGEVAAVLRTGISTSQAWQHVASAQSQSELAGAGRRGASGLPRQPVSAIAHHVAHGFPLRESRVCRDLGSPGAALIAAEEVSLRTGAPLGPLLTTIAAAIRADLDAAAIRKVAYAGPKSTIRVLGMLPFASLALGYALGADPFAVLSENPFGRIALVLGVVLGCAGWYVPRRMMKAAEKRSEQQ